METIEKPNIFDVESVTIKHSKTVTKLSKPIKELKIISQQTNKIKFYAESKTASFNIAKSTCYLRNCYL